MEILSQKSFQIKVNLNYILTSIVPTLKLDFPGAAVISRNVISYEAKTKGRTSRSSKRKISATDSDYGKSTNVVVNKSVTVKTSTITRVSKNKGMNLFIIRIYGSCSMFYQKLSFT